MSARSVWSGTRPSRYHSVRAISAPARRPEHRTFTPCAPMRLARATLAHADGAGRALLQGAPKRPAPLELQGDVLGHQLRVQVGAAHLMNVEVDLPAGQFGELALELLDFRPLLPDHDTGPGGIDVDLLLIGRALDLDLVDPRVVQAFLDELTCADVVVQERRVFFLREPTRLPAFENAQAKPFGMHLLAHPVFSYCFSSTTTVKWLVRLRIGV